MAIKVNREQLDVVKQNMMEANQRSHFIIFESVENQTSEALRLITDYDSFQTIKEQHHDEASMAIAQDIVPITDTLAKWALAENAAANNPTDSGVLKDLEKCTNDVLKENKLAENQA
ncbi:hypothetical protein [Secundilactobacillus malefermentans]|uniref:Uncharacterized protein n=1 Tax=Secundilactobacillus malefermentans TaxID=176292 RepID=A0A4R5NPQ7_9LACO|nr:hypothetical protein [Secundilactobacillus malefermentans]KRM58479.1 hypothetical protein FD44_GL000675 [Secundilactobacillus malefermentans DSM 5705 = KCTC 3548]QEA31568.1 hypothetical protein FGL90_04875 [Secundilactobacillus malefermentans]TDG78632.1 hypothetical protein C5L31_001658 [Secundilactobacillus malefermentans]